MVTASMRALPFLVLFATGASAASADSREEVLPAIGQVLNMLKNIVSMVESESSTDEQEHTQFLAWSEQERASVASHIGLLQTEIQTTQATIADLRSQKRELDTTLARVSGELAQETSQLNSATERRREENNAFVAEQQNFDNAIAACTSAVNMLRQHYGDGTPHEAARPQFMSLIHKYMTVAQDAAKQARGHKAQALLQRMARGHGGSLLQQPNNNQYVESTGDANNIVDQVKELAETFGEDKQSGIDAESGLQRAYDTLKAQKQAMIDTLTQERDTQQSQLNTVNQGLAESEGALEMAQGLLTDRQSYTTNLGAQLNAATVAYNARKSDREHELEAVNEGIGVLERVSLLQTGSAHELQGAAGATAASRGAHVASHVASFERIAAHVLRRHREKSTRQGVQGRLLRLRGGATCGNCARVAALLRQQAVTMHSQTLTTAAAAATGNAQLQDVIQRLEDLITNLREEAKTETEHKNWCEAEQRRTSMRRDGHGYAVDEISQHIASLTELIRMKETDLQQNHQDVDSENKNMAEQTSIREADKEEYTEDLQDTMDAIAALNEAVEILANFYKNRNQGSALLQGKTATDPNSGSQVVELMTATRNEFDSAAADLKTRENQAVAAFDDLRTSHIGTENDLHHDGDVITVEEQTAEQTLQSNQQDLASNKAEIAAAESYLKRLGRSCDPLIEHFDERQRLRKEEKTAIEGAIQILKDTR